jgi:nitrite reductase (cytochrome c-552)
MKLRLLAVVVLVAAAIAGVTALLLNTAERKREAKEHYLALVTLTEDTIDPAEWGKNFPRQYDGYRRTVDTARTRHGGSEAFQKLDEDPRWRRLFKGYAFALDYREERGHAFMLSDQDETRRTQERPQPGTCLHCHSAVMPAYRTLGNGDVMKGFDLLNAMPWREARQHVSHPITCGDCHDPKSMQLRVTRPGFLSGLAAYKASQGVKGHDVNKDATRQEMRTYVCAQCHVEYYFKGADKALVYPWAKGIGVEQIEAYYDAVQWKDWDHPDTGAPILKAQHPEFELWSQGIHARSGVACADCHMPYKREGAIKMSDHHVRSPLLNIARACQTCHRYPEREILARAEDIQDRTERLMGLAENAVLALMDAVQAATARGVRPQALADARAFHRKAQWRLDFVAAENSKGFHAPQEAARILGEAIDFARRGQAAALAAGR